MQLPVFIPITIHREGTNKAATLAELDSSVFIKGTRRLDKEAFAMANQWAINMVLKEHKITKIEYTRRGKEYDITKSFITDKSVLDNLEKRFGIDFSDIGYATLLVSNNNYKTFRKILGNDFDIESHWSIVDSEIVVIWTSEYKVFKEITE